MSDPCITKLADVLVNYSLAIRPGQKFLITASPLASELTIAVYEVAIKNGAHVFIDQPLMDAREIFYKLASDEQLDFASPIDKLVVETFDATLQISALSNRRLLSGADPKRIARFYKAYSDIDNTQLERSARGDLHWCFTEYPNNASAQDADMSLHDYTEFVFGACMLNEDDPAACWKEQGMRQSKLVDWLKGHNNVTLNGENIDLSLCITDRVSISADGKLNFPDGEVFTGPVEDSVNGWVRFKYPAMSMGQEIADIELWFENGKVVKEKANKNQELLTANLDADEGARYVGEWGIGTNYGITRFTKNILFDEKIGGTIHLAIGASLPETGGKNKSAVHWDMLCDMSESEIIIDGDLFYKNGKPVVG